jgi:hypothetical protein
MIYLYVEDADQLAASEAIRKRVEVPARNIATA